MNTKTKIDFENKTIHFNTKNKNGDYEWFSYTFAELAQFQGFLNPNLDETNYAVTMDVDGCICIESKKV